MQENAGPHGAKCTVYVTILNTIGGEKMPALLDNTGN